MERRSLFALASCLTVVGAGIVAANAQQNTPPDQSALVSAISGSITHAGRTLTPQTLSFATVAVGGTIATMQATDVKSGPAQIGDACEVQTGTATPLPASMLFRCTITSPGTASITAFPTLGVALLSQTVSVNVFWRG